MMRSTLVCTIACFLIGLGSASLLYAQERIRIEAFHANALDRLKAIPDLRGAQWDDIVKKLSQTSLDDLEKPPWPKQFSDELPVTPEQREEIWKNLVEVQHDEITLDQEEQLRIEEQRHRDEEQKEKLKEFLKFKRVGTLSVRFEFPTVTTDPSTVRVNFTGNWVSGKGLSGKMSFLESTQVDVRGGIQLATVSIADLRIGTWSVSATAVGVAFEGPTRCNVPGYVFLKSVTSQ
jgi:hypothetical protein